MLLCTKWPDGEFVDAENGEKGVVEDTDPPAQPE
jgi:hypothetical protein